MDSLMQTNLYELLQIAVGADEKEIKSAYRKKALTCHPDKNPDNPRAAELFQQLSRALEVLTDPAARSAYDAVLKAREAAKIRHQGLDAKRRKLKEELEAREGPGQEAAAALTAQQRLKKEVERLRREGSRQLAEERELLQRQMEKQQTQQREQQQADLTRVKVRWKQQPGFRGYTETSLRQRLSQYGTICCLVFRNGSALVEFERPSAARLASQLEQGSPDEGPLTVRLLGDASGGESTPPAPPPQPMRTLHDDDDYEDLVLRKLQQAAAASQPS
ncbi:dnaJ homolog subfamily C member 17 [Dermacentor variabilis]|uniref:dnaJ homolog subfamily C member 17 n=1 Tax=Dermacentor variabilis TaxID=34621 RepID=UPI003F5BA5D0